MREYSVSQAMANFNGGSHDTQYSIMERRGGGGEGRGSGEGERRGGGVCPQTFPWLRVNSREGIMLR